MCVSALPAYMCVHQLHVDTLGTQKLHWNPLDLQLGVVINRSVNGGTQTLYLCKTKCS